MPQFTQWRLGCSLCHTSYVHLDIYFKLFPWMRQREFYHAYFQGSIFRVRLLGETSFLLSGRSSCCGSSSDDVLSLTMCKMIQKYRWNSVTYSVIMDFELAATVHYVLQINTLQVTAGSAQPGGNYFPSTLKGKYMQPNRACDDLCIDLP